MDKSTFRKFTLIDTIDQKIHRHMTTIESEEARINAVKSLRSQRSEQLNHASEALKTTKELLSGEESDLFKVEQQLEKSRTNLSTASNQQQLSAIEKEIETLEPKQEEHETIILELMEKIEGLEDSIANCNEFLTGSEKTLNEVTEEVQNIVTKEKEEITSSESEIRVIMEELAPSERELLQLTLKRYRFKAPLTKIEGGSCPKCGSVIDSVTASQVEKGISIEMCPGCNRILIPYS